MHHAKMYTRETLGTVQKFLIDPTKTKTVLCTFVPSASSHLSTDTKHKYKCSFMECSLTWQLEGVLELSAGTTVEMTLKVKILILETVQWTEQKAQAMTMPILLLFLLLSTPWLAIIFAWNDFKWNVNMNKKHYFLPLLYKYVHGKIVWVTKIPYDKARRKVSILSKAF